MATTLIDNLDDPRKSRLYCSVAGFINTKGDTVRVVRQSFSRLGESYFGLGLTLLRSVSFRLSDPSRYTSH